MVDKATRESLLPEARAKALALRPNVVETPLLVPARMINEVLYCERLMALEWVQGEFADNFFTVDGRLAHKRADVPGGALPPQPTGPEPTLREDDGARPYVARSLWLSSESLGLTAKIDVVEGTEAGLVVPIEYKRGKAPDVQEGAYLPERAQLGVQVLLLREHGYRCESAEIYFAASKRRTPIVIDEALLNIVREATLRARSICSTSDLPAPLENSPKCDGCSLIGICLPDETNLLRRAEQRSEHVEPSPVRRLHPARDDRLPLYVTEPGARVGIEGDEIVVRGKEDKTKARLPNTSHVSLFGNVQISSQALRRLMELDVSVSFMSSGGWLYGRAEGLSSNNIDLRMAQHRAATDAATSLKLATAFVEAKIRNSRTMLRRNHTTLSEVVLFELEQLARKAKDAERVETLLGLEGSAARVYFGAFSGMLRGNAAKNFDLDGRNRRPPKDPVNALLSLAYSLLTRDFAVALGDAGLDPMLGFYHRPRFGRPALALDMMEELRPVIADSVVITVLNTSIVGEDDFLIHPAGVSLAVAARKRVILAHERRMDQLVTHPVFGYQISWRRILEVQARLMGRFLLGEIPEYPQLRPR